MAPFYEYGVYLTFSLGNRLWCSSRVAGELRLPSGWRGTPDRMHLMSFLDDEGDFLLWQLPRLVRIDPETGLTPADVRKAISCLLNGNRG